MKTTVITFRCPDPLIAALTRAAQQRGVDRSTVIREALTDYLRKGSR